MNLNICKLHPDAITPTDSTGRAAVDKGYRWRPIDDTTPRWQKLQPINRDAGIADYGVLHGQAPWWTHWAPLPTFED